MAKKTILNFTKFESNLLVTLRKSNSVLILLNRRRLIRSEQSSVCAGLRYELSTGKPKLNAWRISRT